MNRCLKAKVLLAVWTHFQRIIYLTRALHTFLRLALKYFQQHAFTTSPENILLADSKKVLGTARVWELCMDKTSQISHFSRIREINCAMAV